MTVTACCKMYSAVKIYMDVILIQSNSIYIRATWSSNITFNIILQFPYSSCWQLQKFSTKPLIYDHCGLQTRILWQCIKRPSLPHMLQPRSVPLLPCISIDPGSQAASYSPPAGKCLVWHMVPLESKKHITPGTSQPENNYKCTFIPLATSSGLIK